MSVRRLTFAVLAILIGLCGTAQADILAAGPAYGGPSSVGGSITCRIFNFGAFSTSITVRQIWTNTGVSVAPTFDTCTVALAVGQTCSYGAPITGNLAYSCRLIAQGISPSLSGVAEVQNSSHAVLNTLPLQK
jgi:hypothetical protein